MQVDCRINEQSTEAAIFFPEPAPGYTIPVSAEQCDELIAILIDVRGNLLPPPFLPGEEHPADDD